VGNVILGVPFHFNHEDLRPFYTGSFWGLLRPFALLIGLISLLMLIRHGALYTALKVDEPVAGRAVTVASVASWLMVILFIVATIWVYFMKGYVITSDINHNGDSNPTNKTVI